jgi:hypothetical protein
MAFQHDQTYPPLRTALGKPQAVISEEALAQKNANRTGDEIAVSTRHKSKKLRARLMDSIDINGMTFSNFESLDNAIALYTKPLI